MRKSEQRRPYPPDFCSAETLAYRLDCSERTIQDYAADGRLPKPVMIGNMSRWFWTDVLDAIAVQNSNSLATGGMGDNADGDEYSGDIIKLKARATRQAGKETDGRPA
jgi:predicted DNA-binding transcriptional regulator AlpA